MPTRFLVAVGYAGGSVDAEVDVWVTVEQERDPTSPTGWRYPDGTFAPDPNPSDPDERGDLDRAIANQAESVRRAAASKLRSPELRRQVREAEFSVESEERVEDPPTGGVQATLRVNPKDGEGWREYDV